MQSVHALAVEREAEARERARRERDLLSAAVPSPGRAAPRAPSRHAPHAKRADAVPRADGTTSAGARPGGPGGDGRRGRARADEALPRRELRGTGKRPCRFTKAVSLHTRLGSPAGAFWGRVRGWPARGGAALERLTLRERKSSCAEKGGGRSWRGRSATSCSGTSAKTRSSSRRWRRSLRSPRRAAERPDVHGRLIDSMID
jgi:hypothetical protein